MKQVCAVIYYKQERKYRLRANELISGLDTNNEAEYAALIMLSL